MFPAVFTRPKRDIFNYFDGPCGGKFKRINRGKEVTLFLKSDDADTRINTI